MIYCLVPHVAQHWEHMRLFLSYSSMEQVALETARAILASGGDEDWCVITAYEGVDEAHAQFTYWVQGGRLHRDAVPSPSP